MKPIKFTREAQDNLLKQAQYLFEQSRNLDIAENHLIVMKEYLTETLQRFPLIGRLSDEYGQPGIRKLVYHHYTILYRIDSEAIYILAIFRENLPKL